MLLMELIDLSLDLFLANYRLTLIILEALKDSLVVRLLLFLLLLLLFKLQLDEFQLLVRNCLVLNGLTLKGIVLFFQFFNDILEFLDSLVVCSIFFSFL